MTTSLAVFTVCNYAYLPRALALAESLQRTNDLLLNIVIIDGRNDGVLASEAASISFIQDYRIENIMSMAFQYDIIEFSTAVKPALARHFLKLAENVIFLDPDTYVTGSLSVVVEELAGHSILLTPHYIVPQPSTPHESDLAMTRFGSFNLGFFALSACPEAEAFLDWWGDRCRDFCFMESQFGLSTDQKWVAIAPCFFPNLKVSFNVGLNAAPWNTFERVLSFSNGKYLVNGDTPLVFFHFSNFDEADLDYQNKRASCEKDGRNEILFLLASEYLAVLNTHTSVSKQRYKFDYLESGEYVSPTLRRAYYAVKHSFPDGHDPFSAREVLAFAKRNRLLERRNERYKIVGLRHAGEASLAIRVVFRLMRVILRILGPNRFFDFGRLLVFLSLYWRNAGLWKR